MTRGLLRHCYAILIPLVTACSTGPSTPYSVLVTNVVSSSENWTANDSAAPPSWFAPASGWQTVTPSGTWCVHIPASEHVVTFTEVSSAPGANNFIFGYVHPSSTAPSWTASEEPGHVAVSPGPAC
jgi:hypothetical protein